MMDAFTAVAGSGPALVFMFIEALADAAVREGIPRDMAYDVALSGSRGFSKTGPNHRKTSGGTQRPGVLSRWYNNRSRGGP